MPSWNKIIVGNAFKLPSRAPRFYLDLMLWFPTFLAGFCRDLVGSAGRSLPDTMLGSLAAVNYYVIDSLHSFMIERD